MRDGQAVARNESALRVNRRGDAKDLIGLGDDLCVDLAKLGARGGIPPGRGIFLAFLLLGVIGSVVGDGEVGKEQIPAVFFIAAIRGYQVAVVILRTL